MVIAVLNKTDLVLGSNRFTDYCEIAMKKIYKLIAAVSVMLMLAACGGGGGSNQSTEGKTQFQMTNVGAFDLARVDIVTEDGLIQSSRSIQCPASSDCSFKADMEAPGDLLFYDKNGTLVSAYILTEAPGSRAYVRTSRRMMGIYVFDQLRKRHPESADLLSAKLALFFQNYDSPDQLPDDFQELGMYYQYRMVGTGLNTEDFYSNLHARLENAEILEKNLYAANIPLLINSLFASIPEFTMVNSAYAAGEGKCPAGFTAAMTIASGIGDFMIGDGFIPVFGIANELVKDACDDTSEKLDKIQDSINQLYAQLQKTDAKIDQLIDFVSEVEAKNILRQMKLDQATLRNSYVNKYIELVNTTSNKTLKDFVKNQGGLEKAVNRNANLKTVLELGDQWTKLNTGIGDADKTTFVNALQNMCAGSSDAGGRDLLKNRTKCNLLINYYKMIVTSTHGSYISILKDVTETIQAYQSSEGTWIAGNLSKPGNEIKSSWADQYTYVLKPALQANLKKIEGGFSTSSEQGFYKLTEGLSTNLLENLVRVDCKNDSNKAYLTEWVKNGDKSYITVRCKNQGKLYASRYYYEKDTTSQVTNMMGVVIPNSSPTTAKSHDIRNYGTLFIRDDMPTYTGSIPWGTVVVENQGSSKLPQTSSGYSNYKAYSITINPFGSGGVPESMTVRYTKPLANGTESLSYVWKVNYWKKSFNLDTYSMEASMQCLSNACDYSGDGYRVTFKNYDGPDSIWHAIETDVNHNSSKYRYEIDGKVLSPW